MLIKTLAYLPHSGSVHTVTAVEPTQVSGSTAMSKEDILPLQQHQEQINLCVCSSSTVCGPNVCNIHRGHKRAPDPLELELQAVRRFSVWCWESHPGPLQELIATEPQFWLHTMDMCGVKGGYIVFKKMDLIKDSHERHTSY